MACPPPALASLRLLVPPLRLMSAAMWKAARRQSLRHYGMLEDFVAVVTEAVPNILTDRQRSLLLLALRAKMTQEVFGSDPEPKAVQQHLDRINSISLTTLNDQVIQQSTANLIGLTERLLDSPQERQHLLQEVLFDSRFDAALQSLLCDFLCRLDQLLPVPGFKQAAWWLDAAPGCMEVCLQEAESSREELRSLLANHSCQQGEVTTTVGSFAEELLLSSLSRPSSAKSANPHFPVDANIQPEPLPDWVSHADLVREEVVVTEERREDEEEEKTITTVGRGDEEGVQQEVGGTMEQEQEAVQQGEDVTAMGRTSELVESPSCTTVKEPTATEKQPHLALSELDSLCHSPDVQSEELFPADQSDELCPEDPPPKDSAPLASISHNAERMAHRCPQCGKCFIYRSQVVRHLRSHRRGAGSGHCCSQCGSGFRSSMALKEHQRTSCSPQDVPPCGRSSSSAREHQRHLLPHRNNPCFQCGAAFRTKPELASHLRSHRARPPHRCAQCGKHFRLLSSLTNHRQTHATAGGFGCTRCERVFSTVRERDAHRQVHRTAPLACPSCPDTFSSQAKLIRHQQDSHPAADGQQTHFKCRFCHETFTGLTQLRIHQRSHVLKTFKCDQCDKAFSSLGGLQSHKATHSGEKPYLCTHCGKRFRTKDGLEGHQRIHTGEKPHRCSYCGKAFTALAGLNVHVRRHTGERPYVCEVCGKGWPSGGDLQKHMRSHTGERPYVCSECGKGFSISCHLTEHMRSHTGERPYSCPDCGKRLKRKFDLKNHMLSHSDVRPYPCSYCDKSYTRRTHLNRHLHTHMTTT